MIVLLGIAFLAGVITAISPCVLPVLPIVLAGGASGSRRRPYAIIAGLLISFSASILVVTWLLDEVGLRKDLLRDISIALLFVVAATLLFPQFGELLERPLSRLSRRPSGDLGGGFVLGLALGLVFVPCGGPILAYVTTNAASLDLGAKTVSLTLAYAFGASTVLLAIAIGGRAVAERLRSRVRVLRPALGVIVAGAALLIAFDVDRTLQTKLSDYTDFLQRHTEKTAYAQRKLGGEKVRAGRFRGIEEWLNTPGGRALDSGDLSGKVVLVDFWTYSCINCLRTLPHLRAWDEQYRSKGLVIVGVHTPEFAFEHEISNVRKATKKLAIRYPVAIDNDYKTWEAFKNQYWPAEYIFDRSGRLRDHHFGEGEYDRTERVIRQLLAEPTNELPVASRLVDPTPQHLATPETYLGYEHGLERFAGLRAFPNVMRRYAMPAELGQSEFGYGGEWRVEPERIVSGDDARLRLRFFAKDVFLVLGGRGSVQVYLDRKLIRTQPVGGLDRLYTLLRAPDVITGLLELRFTPGISAYAFTFG
jgi:cytochrome c biogenesis protein CcdA/thiol-disulfide isomerase/thioredoxin